ncbi:MAG: hypothetical protein BIFFINMI_00243 [Phycisphaerae bacterium]|nr:hypothetical protein [Phycisphaerae bacterium]
MDDKQDMAHAESSRLSDIWREPCAAEDEACYG